MGVGFVFYCFVLLWLAQAVASKRHKPGDCGQQKCGNVSITYPFGIGEGCYTNTYFEVTCNKTGGRKKPFLKRLNLELLDSSSDSVVVNHPVIYFNCGDNDKDNNNVTGAFTKILDKSPLSFSTYNSFGSIGCGNLATVLSNRIPIGSCLQQGCGHGQSCTSYLPEDLSHLAVNMTQLIPPAAKESNRCSSAFIFDHFDFPRPTGIGTTHVPARLEWRSNFTCDLEAGKCHEPGSESKRTSCRRSCGGVLIEYPFGIEHGCYMNDWFKVSCINITDQQGQQKQKAFINKTHDLELLNTSFLEGQIIVNNPITYSDCPNKKSTGSSVNLKGSPFFFSTSNYFASVGCGNLAIFHNHSTDDDPIGSCLQPSNGSDGGGCALRSVSWGLNSFAANMKKIYPSNNCSNISCPSAFLTDYDWWSEETNRDQINGTHVPSTLQFATPKTGFCELKEGSNTNCAPDRTYCWTNLTSIYLCVCSNDTSTSSYYYYQDVCTARGKCGDLRYRYCYMLCLNEPGNYCSPTSCPPGYVYDSDIDGCEPKRISRKELAIVAGSGTGIGTLVLLLAIWFMYKVLKRRRKIRRKQRYFKQNGGLLLQQQLSCNEGKIETIRFFTSKELEKATDHYNENRVLGQGAQGIVYKGMLADGRIVAIKKPKVEKDKKKAFLDEKQLVQWVNEVMILSQINHRNVVKLLGCCLEIQFPLLVHEFIPNGTLSEMINDQSEEFPLTWEMRLRIAIEAANALSYLHSAASFPIYHRDVKSTNILLDDKYRAKVSDFGISKSVGLEQTHLTTTVQGTFGYLDPEYFQSHQFTEKSDVYSFGVILAELLTGQKPFSSVPTNEEVKSLVPIFLLSMKEGSLLNILDPRVRNDGSHEEIMAIARLAKRCLNLKGKRRPTMKQVAVELESIRAAPEDNFVQQIGDVDEDSEDDRAEPWVIASCSATSILLSNDSATSPLLFPDACDEDSTYLA